MPLGPLLVFGNDQASNPGAVALTLYCQNPIVSGASAGSLTSTVPAASTSTTGWTVGTTASGNYSRQTYNVEVPATGFTTTVQPSGNPIPDMQDTWRFGPSTGTFSLGTWYSSLSVIGVTSGGDQDGRIRARVWRSLLASGSTTSDVVVETFNRADASPIGENWVTEGGGGLKIVSNTVRGVTLSADNAARYGLGVTWSADHYAEAVISAAGFGDGTNDMGVQVRMQSGVNSGYLYEVGSANNSAILYRAAAGSYTNILTLPADTYAVGDVIRLEAFGNRITAYRNGVARGTVFDSTYATGMPGIHIFSNPTTWSLDTFKAGVFVGLTPVTDLLVGTTVTNLSTTVAQSSIASQQVPMFRLANEYLFYQAAWEITGAGAAADRDVLVRYGSMSATDGSGVLTAPFLVSGAAPTGVLGGGAYFKRRRMSDGMCTIEDF